MEGFQKIVFTIAYVTLCLSLLFMGFALYKSKRKEQWPPMVPSCPDWWILDGSGNASSCVNVKDLGVCSSQTKDRKHQSMNFNTPMYTGINGSNGACAKYKWATKCKVSWDGITYGAQNPCN